MPVCAIVGMGPGLGLAVARRFGREGFAIGAIARRAESLAGLTATLEQEAIPAHGFAANAVDTFALNAAMHGIEMQIGPVDVLVYNAAAIRETPPSALTPEDLLADLRVGVAGALACAQALLPGMKARGKGTILFTGGGFAFEPMAGFASLGVEKAAIRNLAFSLHQELAPLGIHVATVTICGMIGSGERFAPATIAGEYWRLHVQPPGSFERESLWK